MTLPVIQQPIFETTLPSTKELITFRAFTVKEEKNSSTLYCYK